MIVKETDSDGKVIAYIDYDIVDQFGHRCQIGRYCFVREAWIHKSAERKGFLRRFIMKEHLKFPTLRWIYWKRRKYGDRSSIYDIRRLYKKER